MSRKREGGMDQVVRWRTSLKQSENRIIFPNILETALCEYNE